MSDWVSQAEDLLCGDLNGKEIQKKGNKWGFLCGSVVKNLPWNTRVVDSFPALGRSLMPWDNQALGQTTEPASCKC